MKRSKLIAMGLIACLTLGIVGCGAKETPAAETTSDKQVITVGTSSICKDVLEVAQQEFNATNEEYQMEVKVFDDAITPNLALNDGSIDANFYQYTDYLTNFNKERSIDLKTTGTEVFGFQTGLYSEKFKSLDEITEGATVAIANDAPNRAVAFLLLKDAGLIDFDESIVAPTVLDVKENKLNLQFKEMERLNLGTSLKDVDLVVAMADVILEAGGNSEAALAWKKEQGIIVAVKETGNPWEAALETSLHSDKVKKYIEEETKGTKAVLF